ncbi:bridging integrator 3, partial [Numida meleagris]|uniref:bridging integrator 3 n=1 Tax=Numida meleagris TaxID=8996 RepID=UPI000B3D8AC9
MCPGSSPSQLQASPPLCSSRLEEQTKKLQKDMRKSTDADLAMSKSAVKISSDLLSNPLCEQDAAFLDMVTAFDTAMKRMDSFNQEKA